MLDKDDLKRYRQLELESGVTGLMKLISGCVT
jgi:hypothetical protein